MRQFALDIVSRYKRSTTILYWEMANELNSLGKLRTNNGNGSNVLPESDIRDYIVSLSADIKAIDSMHMVDAGLYNDDQTGDHSYYTYYLQNTPNIDIINIHLYEPQPNSNILFYKQPPAVLVKYFKDIADAQGKVLVIGETGVNAAGWGANNFNNYAMSMMLAKTYLKVPLSMPWTWESKYIATPNNGLDLTSLDPGEDDDAISILNRPIYHMGDNNIQFSYPITGDFNGDGSDDFGVKTDRGLWQLSLVNGFNAAIPSQWLGPFGDKNHDPGGAPFVPVTGDWDGNGKQTSP